MFIKLLFTFLPLLLFCSCYEKKQIPNTDIDVARSFIQFVQQGDMEAAASLMLKDEENDRSLKQLQTNLQQSMTKKEEEEYKHADIIINELANVSDSVTIINYSVSVKKENKSKVKVVKVNGQWLIDLKYTFSGNM